MSALMLKFNSKDLLSGAFILGASAAVLCFPNQTESFEFLHIAEPLTISISSNAPARAILEDEIILSEIEHHKELLAESTPAPVPAFEAKEVIAPELSQEKEINLAPLMLIAKQEVAPIGVTTGDVVPAFGEAFNNVTQPATEQKSEEEKGGSRPEDILEDRMIARSFPKNFHEATPVKPEGRLAPVYYAKKQDNEEVQDERQYEVSGAYLVAGRSQDKNTPLPAQIIFSGTLELTEGLALGAGGQIEIYHTISGAALERGEVSVAEGKYEILVQDPQHGFLVAEVRDQEGLLIGLTKIDLAEVDYSNLESGIRKTQHLALRPVAHSLEGGVKSAYSNGDAGVAGATISADGLGTLSKTDKSGRFHIENILPNSQAVLKATKEEHWGSIVLAENSKNLQLTVYPDSMIKALAQIAEVDADYIKYGIIWGRVEANGKPAKGAVVEATSPEAIGPIYFNALQIPDKSLEATGENGLFAYLKVEPGFHVVRAKHQGRTFPAKVTVAEKGNVSRVDLEIGARKRATVLLYDAINGLPIEGTLEFSGTDKKALARNGLVGLRHHAGQDLMFLEAEAQSLDYLGLRQTVSRTATEIFFPFVKRQWVEQMLGAARANRLPYTGMVVGFVRGADYQVVLPEGEAAAEVIYFSSNGSLIGKEEGLKDGGFIVINLSTGLKTIGIQPNNKKAMATKILFSDTQKTSVINYNF